MQVRPELPPFGVTDPGRLDPYLERRSFARGDCIMRQGTVGSECYGREKLAPILSLFTVDGQEQGLSVCRRLLANQGAGHTAVIHSSDERLQQRFGREVPASRILVNGPATHGCIGIGNGLVPSLTLGCGTFGGNSTTDNVTYTNLLNIKRLARPL
jgi:acetaldehyde dehydrogenase/alcohol dehydrogenase